MSAERYEERLRILHEIDRAMAAEEDPEAIAAAVIRPLRELLGVPRAIVNRFDLARGEVEWMAAAGRKNLHVGPGVRYGIGLMGDLEGLRRGEPQKIDTRRLPPGPEVDALLASGVDSYLAVPMIASGELLGAISFGGDGEVLHAEQVAIAREVAAQLAIALVQSRLLKQVRQHAAQLEARVADRTAALEAARRELEDLYDRAPCGYHSVDPKGVILRINDTWLSWLGYAREEVVGRMNHADLMTPESARKFREEVFPRFLREGYLEGAEFEYRRKDGTTFTGALNATSIYDAAGRYVMSRSTVFDVTARKRSEERLSELNKELESFSYSVSHDLRAPLRAIDGYARMLDEDSGPQLGDEGRRLLGVVRSSARRMGRLIDDLLEFSRLGQLEPARSRLDMAALVRETAAELGADHPRATVDVADLPPAPGDRALLKQVWSNLLGNALKYSAQAEAPRIEIAGRTDGEMLVYSVRDNGVGFDMRYAGKLFGVFQRLHRQDEFPGTGVGLAIVQRIVSRHGGRVWADARPGEGACFSFSLPAN